MVKIINDNFIAYNESLKYCYLILKLRKVRLYKGVDNECEY